MTGTDSSQTGHRLVAGRYRLTAVLGRGGMGVVWQATDELIGRTVAVKELRVPQGLPERERAAFGERALREARTAGRIRHPGVIAIHDLIPDTTQDDAAYVVMELVEAPSLATVLERDGALPERRVARLGLRVLEALNAAHAIGLVHRDVKPSNILVLPDDEVKLVDFGIAHALDDTRLTRTGVAGSTGYIAPELFEGEPPTPAVDLWSLGVTLHHAATGSSPFERGSTAATIRAVLHEDPPPLDRHPSLSPVIGALLVRDPDRRMDGREAAVGLRSAVTSARNTAPEPVRQAPRPDEATGRPATWQNRPTGVHPRLSNPGRPRARADTTGQASAAGRDTATGSPRQPGSANGGAAAFRRPAAQRANGGSRPATWEDRPTTVRSDTARARRSTARPPATGRGATPETTDDAERYAIYSAKALLNSTFRLVLALLSAWTFWRLFHDLLAWPTPVTVVEVVFLSYLAQAYVSTWWDSFALGTEGILLSAKRGNASVAWEHIDEIVLVPQPHTELTHRDSRTAITLRMAATTPADVRKKSPLRGVDRTGAGSAFAWSMGEVNHSVDELSTAFRAAAPLHVTVASPSEPDVEDLRYHGARRTWPMWLSLLLAGILVATYAFHDDGGPVQLEKTGWEGVVEFSPDGATLASGNSDYGIELWNVATRKRTTTLMGQTGKITALRFAPDRKLLAVADDGHYDHTITVWDMPSRTERRTLSVGEDTSVVWLAFSPDSHTLASVNDDRTIVLWDVRSGRKTLTIPQKTSRAFPVEFSAAGLFLSGLDSAKLPHRWYLPTGRPVSPAAGDADWATIAGSTVYILDGSGSIKRVLTGHTGKITDVDPAKDAGQLLATSSEDHTVRIWRADTGRISRKLTLDWDNGRTADAVALSRDGRTLVYGSGSALWIWETGIDA
ncbi:protein kinase [Streptomyces canus]|uniref:WD40 repeat domain-containing serine/threonine protein kinase n=1 Tax=Streptomyces canus TaxID=58343 RepID=UPI0030E56DC9